MQTTVILNQSYRQNDEKLLWDVIFSARRECRVLRCEDAWRRDIGNYWFSLIKLTTSLSGTTPNLLQGTALATLP